MDEDRRKKLDETMSELDLRLGGLLGKLGDALNEAVSRLETGDDGEVRRTHEIETPKGPLRAETGVRVRLGGLDAGAARGRDPARPVNDPGGGRGRRPDAATARPRTADSPPAGSEASMHGATDRGSAGADAGADADGPPRRPHLEAYRDGPRWVLCADLPGVRLPEIDVRIEDARIAPGHERPDAHAASGEADRSIVVETRGPRRYALEHPLPPDARPGDMQIVLRNGVLEVALGTGDDGGSA
jgi:HSP20 family molecular chaperone IbpA